MRKENQFTAKSVLRKTNFSGFFTVLLKNSSVAENMAPRPQILTNLPGT